MNWAGRLAVALAIVTAPAVVLLPLGRLETCTATGTAPATGSTTKTSGGCTTSTTTLLASEGYGAALAAGIPVLFAAGALAPQRGVRIAAAALLSVFCLLAGFSIGLFFVPSAVLVVIAAARSGATNVSARRACSGPGRPPGLPS
ncbi:MAG: hypothetical protein ABI912_07080 [Actinomycetota bacterium]